MEYSDQTVPCETRRAMLLGISAPKLVDRVLHVGSRYAIRVEGCRCPPAPRPRRVALSHRQDPHRASRSAPRLWSVHRTHDAAFRSRGVCYARAVRANDRTSPACHCVPFLWPSVLLATELSRVGSHRARTQRAREFPSELSSRSRVWT